MKDLLGKVAIGVAVVALLVSAVGLVKGNSAGQVGSSFATSSSATTQLKGNLYVTNDISTGGAIYSAGGVIGFTTTTDPSINSLTVAQGVSAVTSTFSGQVGFAKCVTAKTTGGTTVYETFTASAVVVSTTKPSDCN